MLTTVSLRRACRTALALLMLAGAPAAAHEDSPHGARAPGCAGAQSFWRDTADACAECAARLRQAEARVAYRTHPAYPRPGHPAAYPGAHGHVPPPALRHPSSGARAPGLLPVTARATGRTHAAVGRALDPVVDPVLRETSEAVGTVAGTALGVALYPPFKVLEHVLGAPD